MGITENKAVTRRLHDAVNRGEIDELLDLLADDYREQNAISPTPIDKAGSIAVMRAFRAAVPDLHRTLEQQTAEDDRVVDRFTWRGTSVLQFRDAPPGTSIHLAVLCEYRIRDGQIAEVRWFSDRLT
jgi:steroid delta-isomerase-like uncharacterized protein